MTQNNRQPDALLRLKLHANKCDSERRRSQIKNYVWGVCFVEVVESCDKHFQMGVAWMFIVGSKVVEFELHYIDYKTRANIICSTTLHFWIPIKYVCVYEIRIVSVYTIMYNTRPAEAVNLMRTRAAC